MCRSRCTYCSVDYVEPYDSVLLKDYLDRLLEAIRINVPSTKQGYVNLGGGTPTVLEEKDLLLLAEELEKKGITPNNSTFSIKTTPNEPEKFEIL